MCYVFVCVQWTMEWAKTFDMDVLASGCKGFRVVAVLCVLGSFFFI